MKSLSGARSKSRHVRTSSAGATGFTVAAGVLLLCGAVLKAQPRKAPEKIEPGSCLSAPCHGALAKAATVHRPVKKKECDACHDQDDEKVHKFSYIDTGSELCYGCHDSLTKKKKFIHRPLKDAKRPCLTCHDAHATEAKHLVKAKSVTALCGQCHEDVVGKDMYHQSDKAKGCTGCHDSHAANLPKIVVAAQPDQCYRCHEDLKKSVAARKVVHGPVATGCTTCHDPHRKRTGKGLAKASPDLCMTCHKHFEKTFTAMSKRHPLLLAEDDCGRCHEPHAASRKLLLRASQMDLCLGCHDKSITTAEKRVIEPLADLRAEGVELHGPLARKKCTPCHEPHGGGGARFLTESHPETFYSAYAAKNYGLCFKCHDESLAEARLTTGDTDFRNGKQNLHYLHVNKTDKGRTCRACHSPHASKNDRFVRDSVAFGEWKLPIGFSKTPSGGTCASGCHAVKSYDRIEPAVYDAANGKAPPRPAVPPTRPAAPAIKPAAPATRPTTRAAGGSRGDRPSATPPPR